MTLTLIINWQCFGFIDMDDITLLRQLYKSGGDDLIINVGDVDRGVC